MKNIFLIIFGGGGSWWGPTSNPGLPNFQDSKTSSYSRQIYNKGKNQEFFIYGPQCEKYTYLDIGGGGGLNVGYDWAHLASQLSSHLNQYTCQIWKQSVRIFYVNLRTMKCVQTWRNDD